MSTLPLQEQLVNVDIPSRFVHLNEAPNRPLVILLHGYADSGPSFLRRVHAALPGDFEVLAPNGLFPLPQQVGREWKEAYAWYFVDADIPRVLIPQSLAAHGLAQLVEKLNLKDRRKILCGFSQGGFFLPYAASQLKNVEALIGIGSGYRSKDYERLGVKQPVWGLHGEADEVVPLATGKEHFQTLKQGRQFFSVPGMRHAINEAGLEILKKIFDEVKK